MEVVIDTNVPMVASRLTADVDGRCVGACINRLQYIQQAGGLLIDDSGLVLREYTKNLGYAGQPGAGHVFVKWVHDNQAVPAHVRRVPITPTNGSGWRRYREFPDHPNLERFDKSDQKFVAVALASGKNPPILNAVDSDWWHHRAALADAGVTVEFLCPQQSRASPAQTGMARSRCDANVVASARRGNRRRSREDR